MISLLRRTAEKPIRHGTIQLANAQWWIAMAQLCCVYCYEAGVANLQNLIMPQQRHASHVSQIIDFAKENGRNDLHNVAYSSSQSIDHNEHLQHYGYIPGSLDANINPVWQMTALLKIDETASYYTAILPREQSSASGTVEGASPCRILRHICRSCAEFVKSIKQTEPTTLRHEMRFMFARMTILFMMITVCNRSAGLAYVSRWFWQNGRQLLLIGTFWCVAESRPS